MAKPRIDMGFLPLSIVSYDGPYTNEEFVEHLEEVAATMYAPSSGTRVMIQDARRSGGMSARQRAIQAEWLRKHDAKLRELTLGTAFVTESALVRGMLTAILWLHPLPTEHEVCADFEQALSWAEKLLNARAVPLPHMVRVGALAKYGRLASPA